MDNNLLEVLMPIAVMGSLAFGITLISKTFTDYFLKKRIIEKGIESNLVSELLKNQTENDGKLASLKWGLIILFGGIGLIVLSTFTIDPQSPLPYGIFATSVSLGFLSYYLIASKKA